EVLENSSKKMKFSIINIDDPYGLKLYEEISGEKISYSLKNKKSDIYSEKYKFSDKGITAEIKTPRGRLILRSKLLGEHNLYNLMAAAGTALQIGSSIESIEKALNSISHIPGRLEVIENKQNINVLVDYAHTPDALQNVLSSLRPICKGRLITVVGCGGDRDKKKRPLMGKIAEDNSDYLIITSDNPRTENPELIIEDILRGINKTNNSNFKTIIDREEAISHSINIAKTGDTVLIAGKGHENYQIVGVNKFHFDDREVAKKYLRKKELQ
ncbi:MAG: Mur ligase family protein, partial [Thermodesulfobacteriota bacterium]